VAEFLITQGIPPDRLAARGFAEFQPLDPGEGADAYRRNRRIEIKLTTR
jgi:chemotaxis protein MotB